MAGRNEATTSATTLGVIKIASHERASNKLGRNQSSGSNLLEKNVSIVAQLPCFWQGVEIAPSAMTLGVVDIAPYASPSNKLGINQSNGSILLGKNASIVAQLPCFWQGVEITPSTTTLGVVDIAPYASPSNKLGINQPNGSILLGKMRSSSQMTIKGHGEKSIEHGRGCSLRQTRDKKSTKRGRGRSLHQTHDKKSMYHERRRSLRETHDKKYVHREIYNPNLVTCSLQIDSEEKDHLSARRAAISEHFLMGRTCAGSECSKSSEHLGPRDI
jgi:hypothetical protein